MCFSCICLFVCVSFCHFSLPLGVEGWLWFVIVALPVLFYYFFFECVVRNVCDKAGHSTRLAFFHCLWLGIVSYYDSQLLVA